MYIFRALRVLITYSLITPKYALRCVFLYLSTVIFNSIIFHIYVSFTIYVYGALLAHNYLLIFIILSLCLQQYKYSNFNTTLFYIYVSYIYIYAYGALRAHLLICHILYAFIYKCSNTLI